MRNIVFVAAGLVCFSGFVMAAEQLGDPTRPAFELVPGLSADGSGAPAAEKVETPPAGLQSVIISPTREAAIINGVEVERGHRYGDAELVVVNETCVVLIGPQGRQVMHMFPNVNMTKNQLACVKQQTMKSVTKLAKPSLVGGKVGTTKKRKAKKRPVVCAPEVIKDGSNK